MEAQPKCIIVTGQAGSGKTTFAKRLGQRLWMPVVSRDELKEGYVNSFEARHDELPPDTDRYVTDFFFETISSFLSAKISLIAEAAFQHKVWEPRVAEVKKLSALYIILCSMDPIAAARRHLQRGLDNPERERYHGDNRVVHFRKTGEFLYPAPYEPPRLDIPTMKVSTDGEYFPSMDDIAKQIV